MAFEEEQPSQAVPLSKIDFYLQSIAYVNSLSLPTESEATEHGICFAAYDEEVDKICNELFACAIQWDIKIDKITKKDFYGIKGLILKKIRKNLEELEEISEEEIPSGGLPPRVGEKIIEKTKGKKK